MSDSKPKRSRGRPTDFKPEYGPMLIEHMRQGFSFEAFAGAIGKCEKTLFNWLENNPDFLQSKKAGTAAARLFWERIGIDGLSGNIPGFNATTWIFNMKNRFGWRDRQDVEHSGPGGAPLQIKVVLSSPNPFAHREISADATPLESSTKALEDKSGERHE